MKYTFAFAILLSLTLTASTFAQDWDKRAHPGLYTISPDPQDTTVVPMGLIVFYQGKITSVFGSDASATLEEAVKTLEQRTKEMGADFVCGVSFNPIVTGDPGIIVCGTAYKLRKK
jgi:hypothetical protein